MGRLPRFWLFNGPFHRVGHRPLPDKAAHSVAVCCASFARVGRLCRFIQLLLRLCEQPLRVLGMVLLLRRLLPINQLCSNAT